MKTDFSFKQFSLAHDRCQMKVGTDAVLLGAWTPVKTNSQVLDIGTGCGIIALMIAQRCECCLVEGIDLDEPSAKQALENTSASPFADRVKIFHSSLQKFSPGKKYDLIVSNPPYFENSLLSGNSGKDSARHTLDLTFDELLEFAGDHLNQEGKVSLIIPHSAIDRIENEGAKYDLFPERICHVYSHSGKKNVRAMIVLSRNNNATVHEDLVMFLSERIPTEEYRQLTRDFYLHF